jgi:hypothetical protein
MHRYDAAPGVALENDVASALPNLLKPEPFQGALNLGARQAGQLKARLIKSPGPAIAAALSE